MAAHQYTDADARQVFDQDMSEVWGCCRGLADRQRPAVQRAAGRLQGQPEPEPEPEKSALEDADVEPDPGEEADGELEG
jgi:hypothetical protein